MPLVPHTFNFRRVTAARRRRLARAVGAASALIVLLFAVAAVGAPSGGWHVEPTPSWVTPVASGAPGLGAAASSGERCLLFDHQIRTTSGTVESYMRVSNEILNEAGLSSASQVRIDFDPTYQTLAIHLVVVHRAGATLDRLVPAAIKIVQREQGLEEQLFDGRQSAVLFVDDLRIGDVLEYAFTLHGRDPTLGGHFAGELFLGASQPIAHLHARLVVPSGSPPHLAAHGPPSPGQAHEATHGNALEYDWDVEDAPAYVAEDLTPSWASTYPWIEVSDFDSWQDVATWGARLFETKPPPPSSALAAWVKTALAETASGVDFALRALRFVQDEVRYVGIETGMGRRQPTDPATVFARRYGDCKDKTALLVAILRMAEISAVPSLVSSTRGHVLDASIPTPDAFDHAIVRIGLRGKTLWVDPTASLEGGGLRRHEYSPYERALSLDPHTNALSALTEDPANGVTRAVRDHFTVRDDGATGETLLDSERTYYGSVADAMRVAFRGRTPEQKSKFLLGLYQQDFPAIHEVAPVEQTDDRERNVLQVTAHLGIPGFWHDGHDGRLAASVNARSLEDLLPRPPSTKRSQPIAVPFPFHATHVVTLDLPFDLPVHPETTTTDASCFVLDFASRGDGRKVTYSFEVSTRAPAVSDGDIGPYLAHADDARARLGRAIWRYPPLRDGINWGALVAFAGCIPFIVFGAVRAYRFVPARLRAPWAPAIVDPHLQGIGGWLILLAIGIVMNPLYMLSALAKDAKAALSLASWRAITSPELPSYSPGIAVLIVAETLAAAWFAAYGVAVAILFFRKVRSFPYHFAVFAPCMATFVVLDHVLAGTLSNLPGAAERSDQRVLALVRTVMWAAIWVAYVLRSRRVASTFVT